MFSLKYSSIYSNQQSKNKILLKMDQTFVILILKIKCEDFLPILNNFHLRANKISLVQQEASVSFSILFYNL